MQYHEIDALLVQRGFKTENETEIELSEDDQFRLRVLAEEIVGYSLDEQDFVDYGYASTDGTPVVLDYLEQCNLSAYIYCNQERPWADFVKDVQARHGS